MIKSLKRIVEADTEYDSIYNSAKQNYDEAKSEHDTKHKSAKQAYKAAKQNYQDVKSEGDSKYKAAKQNYEDIDKIGSKYKIAKQNYDVSETAKAKIIKAKAAEENTNSPTELSNSEDKPGVLGKVGRALSEHPYLAAGTVAGIAGLVALQKRKNRLPEPGRY
jgi:hypothetical protein